MTTAIVTITATATCVPLFVPPCVVCVALELWAVDSAVVDVVVPVGVGGVVEASLVVLVKAVDETVVVVMAVALAVVDDVEVGIISVAALVVLVEAVDETVMAVAVAFVDDVRVGIISVVVDAATAVVAAVVLYVEFDDALAVAIAVVVVPVPLFVVADDRIDRFVTIGEVSFDKLVFNVSIAISVTTSVYAVVAVASSSPAAIN